MTTKSNDDTTQISTGIVIFRYRTRDVGNQYGILPSRAWDYLYAGKKAPGVVPSPSWEFETIGM